MLRRDYFLRMIQELFLAIARLLSEPGALSEKQKEIEALYTLFGADRDFFRSADKDELISRVATIAAESSDCQVSDVPQDEMAKRLESLAALLYADFAISDLSDALRYDVAVRSLWLYQKADSISDSYSDERLARIALLKEQTLSLPN